MGWTYHRRVAIVNLSATRSSCRYIGLFEDVYYDLYQPLTEMLQVKFTCPGFLGTGLSARLELEFTPRLLSDGSCVVRFQAPNGEFQVPVRFVAQRCEPSIGRQTLEFGDLVLGTKMKKTVMLRNTGSKGCRFTFHALTPAGGSEEAEEQQGTSGDTSHSDTHRPGSAGEKRTSIATDSPTVRVSVSPDEDDRSGAGASPAADGPRRPSLLSPAAPATGRRRSLTPPRSLSSRHWSLTASVSSGVRSDSPRPDDLPVRAVSSIGGSSSRVYSAVSLDADLRPDPSNYRPRSDSLRPRSSSAPPLAEDSGLSVIEAGETPPSSDSSAHCDSPAGIVGSILHQMLDRLPIIDFDGGLGVCGSGEGELPAHGAARLHLGCVADLEGSWTQQFIVEFDDPHSPPVSGCTCSMVAFS